MFRTMVEDPGDLQDVTLDMEVEGGTGACDWLDSAASLFVHPHPGMIVVPSWHPMLPPNI